MTLANRNKPLVTLALFAFRQERFVAEAIRAAFEQRYQPLEIILSDDCSPDGTFSIMREMAESYRGPHIIRLNQNKRNLGTFHHVMNVGRMAQGELVVVAAGDDISSPERSEVLYQYWVETEASALCSDHDVIDEMGSVIRTKGGFPENVGYARYLSDERKSDLRFLQGSTAAYSRGIFDLDTCDFPKAYAEDNILGFLLALRGERVAHVPDSLVLYREHHAAVHNRPSAGCELADLERRAVESAKRNLEKMQVYRLLLDHEGIVLSGAQKGAFLADEARLRSAVDWSSLSLGERWTRVIEALNSRDMRAAAWMLLRISGTLDNYQPRRLLYELGVIRTKVLGR